MAPKGAAGRAPGDRRSAPSRIQPSRIKRSRAAGPTRREPTPEPDRSGRQTTFTARAAVLVIAVACVMVAVAVPLKIWLGQRHDIASLTAATDQTRQRLAALNAEHKRWQDPGYVEAQARQRLHLVLPGQKSYIVLGKAGQGRRASSTHLRTSSAGGSWYSTLWASVQAAGNAAPSK